MPMRQTRLPIVGMRVNPPLPDPPLTPSTENTTVSNKSEVYNVKNSGSKRMRVVVEFDVPGIDYERNAFNTAALAMASTFENENRGSRLVLCTTEEL
jgi:hypothetical protein